MTSSQQIKEGHNTFLTLNHEYVPFISLETFIK